MQMLLKHFLCLAKIILQSKYNSYIKGLHQRTAMKIYSPVHWYTELRCRLTHCAEIREVQHVLTLTCSMTLMLSLLAVCSAQTSGELLHA